MPSLLRGISDRLSSIKHTLNGSDSTVSGNAFTTAKEAQLFPKTDPNVDGDDCLHDCSSCSVHLPRKWSIDTDDKLYGHINGWSTHLVVATGKTDWVKDVTDEKGSVMEAVGKAQNPSNGNMMLSASNMPLAQHSHDGALVNDEHETTVLLLPAFTFVDGVTPASVPALITHCVNLASTNTTSLDDEPAATDARATDQQASQDAAQEPDATRSQSANDDTLTLPESLKLRDCPHSYLILLCSQATRDARCGQSAPLLRKEFERHLRPLGLHRDLDDTRSGGVGIYFISHVGGHKYSANCMIYRRHGTQGEAVQCIWLARVRPEDCENIVRYTVLQGKVVKPESQLRGGFDRARQLTSW